MLVRFWGTRGSIPTPGPETLRYGGNTSCVEIRPDAGTLMIFDGGTGARKLGIELAKSGPVRAHLFIGHTHSDHIQGLPFFLPLFLPGSHITLYGPAGVDRSLPTVIGGQMDYSYFPVPMRDLPSRIDFQELGEGEFSVEGVRVRTQYINHTSPCIGYRVEVGGVGVVYATDHEPHCTPLWRPDRPGGIFHTGAMLHQGDIRHTQFMRDADLVIHDAQYTEEEYPKKVGWGHSTVEYAVDVAVAARVKRLALFHHDPTRTDEGVDALLRAASARAARTSSLEVLAAAEGMEVRLEESARPAEEEMGPQAPRVPTRARILIADDDVDVARLLESALQRDGYEVVLASNGAEALRLAAQHRFDLVLLDVHMPEMDGFAVCRALRQVRRMYGVPIVMLTAVTSPEAVAAGFAEGATDYMTKPFAVSQVRARVRSWLTRQNT